MKTISIIPTLLLMLLITSCSTVNVYSDYDKSVDFAQYKTYAFYKPGIDKVEISDLDKKRILRAIEQQMTAKGFTKSDTPDLLVNVFTKTSEQVNVNQFNAGWGYGWGYGWNPYMMYGGGQTSVTTSTQGTLFVDFIDSKKKELVWQGEGVANLSHDINKKEEKINELVMKMIAQYPPQLSKN